MFDDFVSDMHDLANWSISLPQLFVGLTELEFVTHWFPLHYPIHDHVAIISSLHIVAVSGLSVFLTQ